MFRASSEFFGLKFNFGALNPCGELCTALDGELVMKHIGLFAQLFVFISMLALNSVSCRLVSDESASIASPTTSPQLRFISLMKLYLPENRMQFKKKYNTQEKHDAFLVELDMLYERLVDLGDTDTFRTVVELDSSIAASIGVFGIMEIANKNYMVKPSSKDLRKHCLDLLAEYTSHSSPHVRSAALYSLGVMRQYEFKDLVISRLKDTAESYLFFPPFIEPGYGMSADVRTQAGEALKKMLGKTVAIEYIDSAWRVNQ